MPLAAAGGLLPPARLAFLSNTWLRALICCRQVPLQVSSAKSICLIMLLKSEKAVIFKKKLPLIVWVRVGSQTFSAADVFSLLFQNKFQTCKNIELKAFKYKGKIREVPFRELWSAPRVPQYPGTELNRGASALEGNMGREALGEWL